MSAIGEYFEFHLGKNWGIIIFVGAATVAQTGFAFYLHRRYRELSAKYRLLTAECDLLRGFITNVDQKLLAIKKPPATPLNTDAFPPPQYSTFQQNPPKTHKAAASSTPANNWGKNISRVASSATSESDYADAIDEILPPANSMLLNASTNSATSASELLSANLQDGRDNKMESTSVVKSRFEKVDALHEEGDSHKCYDEVKKLYESDAANQKNVELLWRYARACHSLSTSVTNDEAKKKKLLQDGQKFSQDAYKIDENNFNVVKYAAIVTGALTDHLSTKERIQQGFVFKGYLDKGLSMNPREQTLLHMRGRFSYSVANLSWLERKAAAAFFATPPKATFDDAIADFLEVEKIVPGTWIENLLFLGKSYLGKGDKTNALVYLNKVLTIEPADEADKEALNEAKTLIAKNSK